MSADVSAPSARWSLESYFPAFGGTEYVAFKQALTADAAAMLARVQQETASASLVVAIEELGTRAGHLSSYLSCLGADDATNDAVRADDAWLSGVFAEFTKINATLSNRLAALPDETFEDLVADPGLAGAGFAVRRLREQGKLLMDPASEGLAADLNVDGLHAWGRLYETLSGRLEFSMTFPDGHVETVPMSRRRALMSDPDRAVREAAFRDGQRPWETHADTFAAALNGIAGTRLTLVTRRNQADFLEEPLFGAAMDRQTLEALIGALANERGLSQRILRAAARMQGCPLHFFDLEAPQVPAPEGLTFTWDDACRIVEGAFRTAYPALADYFVSMLGQRWIEAEPRSGKRPGAFCTGSEFTREQRVFMTHAGTIQDVVTLAHEVGHAWHSHVLRAQRPLATEYPMTLAETASNFGEMILLEGLERDPASSPALRNYLLDQQMNRAHIYLLNIPARFAFERSFYEVRREGEVSAPRLREMVLAAQREWYGDTLAEDGGDPMFWASKLHFFISGLSFYNFPYAFGYLLGQGLFARFQAEGASFLPAYEEFLRRSGSGTCEDVVRDSLGADIRDPEFWAGIIRTLEPMVARYEALAASSG